MRRDLSACNRSQVMLSKAKSAAGAEVEQHQVMIAPLSASDGYDRIFAISQDSTRRALKFWRLAYTELTSVEGSGHRLWLRRYAGLQLLQIAWCWDARKLIRHPGPVKKLAPRQKASALPCVLGCRSY